MVNNTPMAPNAPVFPVRLVCPACRKPDGKGGLTISVLEPGTAGESDRCPRCGVCYPVLEGIHCVPPDLEAFRNAQADELKLDWLPQPGDVQAVERACARAGRLDPVSTAFQEAALTGIYSLAHYPESVPQSSLAEELRRNGVFHEMARSWLERHPGPAESPSETALEAGCGPGGLLHCLAPLFAGGIVGLDLRVSMLRIAGRVRDQGETWLPFRTEGLWFHPVRVRRSVGGPDPAKVFLVQGDVLDPPFLAETFPVVVAVSLLDAVPDPTVALGQLDALLAPGGLLLAATPYSWDARVTHPQEWWSQPRISGGDFFRSTLAGRNPALPHLAFEIVEQADAVPWTLPGHGRLMHRYVLDVVLARKMSRSNEARPPG